jgi:hypothetical protein
MKLSLKLSTNEEKAMTEDYSITSHMKNQATELSSKFSEATQTLFLLSLCVIDKCTNHMGPKVPYWAK